MEYERERARPHDLENSLWQSLWNSHKSDYGMNGAFFEELVYKNILFRNPKMFQTSQNPNTGYYLRHNKLIHSSEVISIQFTVINLLAPEYFF